MGRYLPMSTFDGCTFQKCVVELDGNEYRTCPFRNSTVVYNGGAVPTMVKCGFDNCQWKFSGSAERTLLFLSAMYQEAAFKPLVEEILEKIKKPKKPTKGKPVKGKPVKGKPVKGKPERRKKTNGAG